MISQLTAPTDDARSEKHPRAREHAAAVYRIQLAMVESTIDLGRRLIVVRATLAPDAYVRWLHANLRWRRSDARHMISTARRFNVPERGRFDPGAILMLGDPRVPGRVARRAIGQAGRGRRITEKIAVRLIEADAKRQATREISPRGDAG